jgi:hemerythrin-like domain-containing protein
MTSREIAQWMREEHAVVEELADQIGARIAAVPRAGLGPWIAETAAHLGDFHVHLRRHFDLEQEGGYLEAVIDRSPALTPDVDRLRHEHDEIDRLLTSIHQDLTAATDQDRIIVEDCCCRVQNLLRYLRDHEEREDLMVVSAFNSDLGTKD